MDSTILQRSGQSLDHWQALYIFAITIALISTFSIVYFAFHREHPLALRTSNYLYVAASLLAVISTIIIVVKTKSLDAEKDRQSKTVSDLAALEVAKAKADSAQALLNAGIAKQDAADASGHLADANKQAAQANQKAAEANATAQEAVLDKTKILNDNLRLQQQMDQERSARQSIEKNLAPRDLDGAMQQQIMGQLRSLAVQDIDCVLYSGNPEAQHLANEIAYTFQTAKWNFYFYSPLGGSVQGVAIEYDAQDKDAPSIARILASALQFSGVLTTTSPNLPPIMQQIGAFSSGEGAKGTAKIRIFVGSK